MRHTNYHKTIETLEADLEDPLAFPHSLHKIPRRSAKQYARTTGKEIRRRTQVVGVFPMPEVYLRLVTIYLMEYSEN